MRNLFDYLLNPLSLESYHEKELTPEEAQAAITQLTAEPDQTKLKRCFIVAATVGDVKMLSLFLQQGNSLTFLREEKSEENQKLLSAMLSTHELPEYPAYYPRLIHRKYRYGHVEDKLGAMKLILDDKILGPTLHRHLPFEEVVNNLEMFKLFMQYHSQDNTAVFQSDNPAQLSGDLKEYKQDKKVETDHVASKVLRLVQRSPFSSFENLARDEKKHGNILIMIRWLLTHVPQKNIDRRYFDALLLALKNFQIEEVELLAEPGLKFVSQPESPSEFEDKIKERVVGWVRRIDLAVVVYKRISKGSIIRALKILEKLCSVVYPQIKVNELELVDLFSQGEFLKFHERFVTLFKIICPKPEPESNLCSITRAQFIFCMVFYSPANKLDQFLKEAKCTEEEINISSPPLVPLDIAAKENDLEKVDILIARGAKISPELISLSIDNDRVIQPLSMAIQSSNSPLLISLLKGLKQQTTPEIYQKTLAEVIKHVWNEDSLQYVVTEMGEKFSAFREQALLGACENARVEVVMGLLKNYDCSPTLTIKLLFKVLRFWANRPSNTNVPLSSAETLIKLLLNALIIGKYPLHCCVDARGNSLLVAAIDSKCIPLAKSLFCDRDQAVTADKEIQNVRKIWFSKETILYMARLFLTAGVNAEYQEITEYVFEIFIQSYDSSSKEYQMLLKEILEKADMWENRHFRLFVKVFGKNDEFEKINFLALFLNRQKIYFYKEIDLAFLKFLFERCNLNPFEKEGMVACTLNRLRPDFPLLELTLKIYYEFRLNFDAIMKSTLKDVANLPTALCGLILGYCVQGAEGPKELSKLSEHIWKPLLPPTAAALQDFPDQKNTPAP